MYLERSTTVHYPEDGGNLFHRNICNNSPREITLNMEAVLCLEDCGTVFVRSIVSDLPL
jgi:hypothetical protein